VNTLDIAWLIASVLPAGAWLYLLTCRGGFWRADQKLPEVPNPDTQNRERDDWPEIVVVVPARNEADVIGRALTSLLHQDYPNPPLIVLVDDRSEDGTASAARAAAAQAAAAQIPLGENHERLALVSGQPRPKRWAGKVWAMTQGVAHAADIRPNAKYILFADADIEHHPANLRELVTKAESTRLDLVSLMVRLATESAWERFLIPPFVFFFAKLYPFAWVNDPANATAAAAGGCMLVRRTALDASGGLAAIHNALIDDCALARTIRDGAPGGGRLWLGYSEKTRSIRPYDGLRGVWDMVARGAFTQLGHSPLLLGGTVLGMAMLYLAPPVCLFWGFAHSALGVAASALAWACMTIAAAPTYRLYGQSWRRAMGLPVAAAFFTAMTVSSAWRYWRGRGGGWKGRTYSQ
jgi:hopene-associated glycosyltransferase HpnB